SLRGQMLELPQVAAEVEAGGFDTSRALERLRRVLGDQRPHPVDSADGDAVRERIVAELRALGLQPQVTDDFACNSHPRVRAVACARVRNIVATLNPGPGRHVLAVAHHDGTALGAGAGDDGIGFAVLLELAAQLGRRELSRPVTLLITDGEEGGLIGARAFLERHPLARNTAALVNLEARGVTGPAIMFETSRPNGAALAAFRPERPVSNSLTTDFYRLVPNSTDVTVFEERPWTILNFAIIGNETRYHSAGDDLAALDSRSVRHMGEQALDAVRRLATGPLPERGGEVHYSDLGGRVLVVVPALLSFIVLGALLVFWSWTGWRRRAALGLAVAAVIAGLVDAAAIAWAGHFLVGLARDGQWWRAHPEVTGLALCLSALAACAAPMLLVRERSVLSLRAAFWLVFLLLAAGLAFVAPGGTILFLAPPLVAAIGIGTRSERAASILAALLLFLLFAPLLHLLETLLGVGSAWMFAPLAAIILWPWLIELKPLLAASRLRLVLAAIFAVTAGGWLAAGLTPAYSEDRQQRFSVEYAVDADRRQAQWAILNDGAALPDAYSRLGRWERNTEVLWGTARRWTAPAPVFAAAAPRVEVLSQRPVAGGRLVALRMASGGAGSVVLRAPPEARVREVRAAASRGRWAAAARRTRSSSAAWAEAATARRSRSCSPASRRNGR
ncbi:MAG TPA: M20/M25/M40 family metallo-hydrolase, partial [Allosphingosinicella sp.]